ncbi:MAG TPA: 50S ribosomal protein L30 [Chitinivibrionales bacterium]|nr:50S ribosomal protein L30 [Chitinivibrionales bacterium]
MAKKIKIKQVKSCIGNITPQKRTLKALGLRRIRHEKTYNDSPALRGMIGVVKHLVEVTEAKEGA